MKAKDGSAWKAAQKAIICNPKRWLVTGAAGFIGSHLVNQLLGMGQFVRGLDNFSTGSHKNIALAVSAKGAASRFGMFEGDITDYGICRRASIGVDCILHMAALGSVPRSMADPLSTFRNNEEGFVTLMCAARDAGVKRVVYASSSSVYGDDPGSPKVEEITGRPLSPYALSKRMNEESAELFTRVYGMECIGLRFFNVFGPRQDPNGAYAAVIPRWFDALKRGFRPVIYGDGETSRDFCYVGNVVQANILAATTENPSAFGQAFNIACEDSTTLNELYWIIHGLACPNSCIQPIYQDFRPGDIAHSLASVKKARRIIGYEPTVRVREGLELAAAWYMQDQENDNYPI